MPAVLAYHRETGVFCVALNNVAHVAKRSTGAYGFNTQPHTLVGDVDQATCQNGRLANVVPTAGIAIPAVFDGGDVAVRNVSGLQTLIARGAGGNGRGDP